jgi:mRNA interferase MazF
MANPHRGEVWLVSFDSSVGTEITKLRPAVVISVDAIGRLPLRIVVPITEWNPKYAAYPWFVHLSPTAANGLTKESGADAFQVKSVSEGRLKRRLGSLPEDMLDEIAAAVALCVGLRLP